MNTLMKWGAAFVAALFELWFARIRKTKEDKDAGRQEVIKGAKDDAAERNKVAKDSDDAWARMSADDRERVRNDKGHYRD